MFVDAGVGVGAGEVGGGEKWQPKLRHQYRNVLYLRYFEYGFPYHA